MEHRAAIGKQQQTVRERAWRRRPHNAHLPKINEREVAAGTLGAGARWCFCVLSHRQPAARDGTRFFGCTKPSLAGPLLITRGGGV